MFDVCLGEPLQVPVEAFGGPSFQCVRGQWLSSFSATAEHLWSRVALKHHQRKDRQPQKQAVDGDPGEGQYQSG